MTKETYRIGVIGGDGTGPEVIREGRKVLEVAAQKYEFGIEWINYDLGGERYKRTGEILPDGVLAELRKSGRHLSGRHRTSRRKIGDS